MKKYVKDLVSIITPCYCCGDFLRETINSVMNQTYELWEMIIVDDCSSDDSYSIASDFSCKDSRIKVLKNDKNRGAAYSRNVGIAVSIGEYVAFLDGDDLWEKQKLEKQIKFMKENNYDFTYTNFTEISSNGENLNIKVSGPKVVTKKMLFNSNYIGCLTVVYNQKKLGELKIRDDIYKRNDHALWLKLIKRTNCWLLDETLSIYRKNNGISKSSITKMLKHHYRLYRLSEEKSVFSSILYVVKNLWYGFFRKKRYTKKI